MRFDMRPLSCSTHPSRNAVPAATARHGGSVKVKMYGVVMLSMALAACATSPPAPTAGLFRDHLFAAPSERIGAADVFAVSDEMKHYLSVEIAAQLQTKGPRHGLIDALYNKKQLRLEYDAELTRNASQTFSARAGNCLSLVIMTAALAKQLGLPVRYQKVLVADQFSRSDDFYFASSHVNLTLVEPGIGDRVLDYDNSPITVDFLAPREVRGTRVRVIGEQTIVAMYMNNRAAESLARGQLDNAYWWTRAAIQQDPKFLSSYNTLGIIYRDHGNLKEAEQVLHYVLALEPDNTQVMSNLALVFNDEGRIAEADSLSQKVERLQPYPPFHFFNLGMEAMRNGDFKTAKELFTKEVYRDAYYHEFHFWLAAACIGLGEIDEARSHLRLAMENSSTRKEHALYAAKLDRIKATSYP
jgi:Flp pilus assembly protein TadD